MDVISALISRHSVRDFLDKSVDDSLLSEILNAAFKGPSASNTQPYLVAIAKGGVKVQIATELTRRFDKVNDIKRGHLPMKSLRTAVSGALPDGDYSATPKYPDNLVERSRACGKGLYGHLDIARGDVERRDAQLRKNFEFFNAPVAMFVFHHGLMGAQSALDAGIFLQSLMLAAQAKGLGTCAQASLAIWAGPVKKHFEVPREYKLICGLSLGYPSNHKINDFRPEKCSPSDLIIRPRSR